MCESLCSDDARHVDACMAGGIVYDAYRDDEQRREMSRDTV